MRHSGLILASAIGLLLAGCAHNDVMVFGTNTTLGLDVESASKTGSGPSIVVGYKREEAVWMPLIVNGQGSRVAPCVVDEVGDPPTTECSDQPWTPGDAKYTSEITTPNGRVQRDVYSVFASLGADFTAKAGGDEVGGGGGLAQFFATGNAAINISSNEALVTALKVESGEGALAQASAVSAAASNSSVNSIMGDKPPTPAQIALADQQKAAEQRRVNLVMTCAVAADGSYRWPAIVSATTLPAPDKASVSSVPVDKLPAYLAAAPSLVTKALAAGTQAPFNCPGA